MKKNYSRIGLYVLIIVLLIAGSEYFSGSRQETHEINYTEFLSQVSNSRVAKVTIIQGENKINGVYVDGRSFNTMAPEDPTLVPLLKEKKIDIKAEPQPQPSFWTTLLLNIIPILILFGLWMFMFNQGQGGGGKVMNFGRSKAKLSTDENKVTFADVAGAEESKQELEEIVEFLKTPKKFSELGARIPKGVLLFGPPGCGKTLLAKAVAGEAGVPFFSISGSDFVEMFVGVGASRVRDLFENAKKSAPCIIFIDEIDAVGRQRGAGLGGGHDEREQTLNQLLVEMDGFGANEGIIIIAATNRPDILDPALLRPGRFDRHVTVDAPDVKGREAILVVHTKGKPVADDVQLAVLARRTPGFTGADLSNLVNEAALLSARRNRKLIHMSEMEEAVERVIAGPERKSKVISERERRLTAYHEAGHTLIGSLIENGDSVHKVTIIPRGRAGGYTLTLPREDRYYATRTELKDKLKVLLAGRIAEEIVLEEISTGAQNDLERVTEITKKMIMEYGMSDKLGPITFGKKQEQVFLGRDFAGERSYSEDIAKSIDMEVRAMVDEAYSAATAMVKANIDKLHLLATVLIEKETLEAGEIESLLKTGALPVKPVVTEQPEEIPLNNPDMVVDEDIVIDSNPAANEKVAELPVKKPAIGDVN